MNRKEDKEDNGSKKDKTAGPKMAFMVGLAVYVILILGIGLTRFLNSPQQAQ